MSLLLLGNKDEKREEEEEKKCQKTLSGLQDGFCSTRGRIAGQTGLRDSESYVECLLCTPEEVLFRSDAVFVYFFKIKAIVRSSNLGCFFTHGQCRNAFQTLPGIVLLLSKILGMFILG